ncbi:unnamed protein product [Phaeothamnion confervicola]
MPRFGAISCPNGMVAVLENVILLPPSISTPHESASLLLVVRDFGGGGRKLLSPAWLLHSTFSCADLPASCLPLYHRSFRPSPPKIKHLRPKEYKNLKKREKTVSRAYGGSRCGVCVRQRVVRAFLIEEQKIVKQLIAEKASKKKAAK